MTQRRFTTLCAFFLLGAFSTAVQVLLIREFLVIFFGNELCLGTIFAAWFLAVFLGSCGGARLAARKAAQPLPAFLLSLGLLACMPAFQLVLIRSFRLWLHLTPGELVPFFPMLASTVLLVFPFSALVGFIFPFASVIGSPTPAAPTQAAPRVYVAEACGSALSGVFLAFYLLPRVSPFQLIASGAMLLLITALLLAHFHQGPRRSLRPILLPAVLLLLWCALTALGFWTFLENETTARRWATINPQMRLLESANSPYQNLAVATLHCQYSIYGNGQPLASFPDSFQASQQAHFLLTEHPHPAKVLLIGGGLSGIITEILKHAVAGLDYVELDPLLLPFSAPYLSPPERAALHDPRVRLVAADGRTYVRNCRDRYDLVISLLPDPSTAMLNRFYTVEFFQETARILAPRGLFVTSLTGAPDYVGRDIGRYAGSVYHSLRQVFPHVLIVPGERTYFFAGPSPGVATSDPDILKRRFIERGIVSPSFSLHHFAVLLHPERRDFIAASLNVLPHPPLNTDSRPISYLYNFILWDLFSGGQARHLLCIIETVPWSGYPALFGCVLLLAFLYLVFRKVSRPQEVKLTALLSISVVGYSAMGLELIFLFAYQNTYGCLYQKIGVLIALFMAGLALGAALMNRAQTLVRSRWVLALLSLHAAIAAFSALLLPAVSFLCASPALPPLTGEILYLSLVVAAGVFTGAAFPVVNSTLIALGLPLSKAAGLSNAYDHLGACFGAALTGTILVPLLGTACSAVLIAIINLVPLLLLVSSLLTRSTTWSAPANENTP